MEYLLKVSALVVVFYASYKLLLERETFFMANRWYFILGLICSTVLPLFVITNYVEYIPEPIQTYTIIENSESINEQEALDFWKYAQIMYLMGTLVFLTRFIIQLGSLFKLISSCPSRKNGRFILVETDTTTPPFSFFNWIVYNPNNFDKAELEQIIGHEKVHSKQYHSLDIIICNVCAIVLWFNPFIWLYNKKLKQNLEFIADKCATHMSPCIKTYQYTLLKTCMPTHQLALGNAFYNSLIKKRIVMLHKSKSRKINSFKYLAIIPFLVWFLMSFNTKTEFIEKASVLPSLPNSMQEIEETLLDEPFIDSKSSSINKQVNSESEVVNEPKKALNNEKTASAPVKSVTKDELILSIINDKSTDTDLDNVIAKFKKHGVNLKFKGIKRNKDGLITSIKIEAESKESNSNFNINSDDSISSIQISYDTNTNNISIGNVSSKDCKTNHNSSHKNCKHPCKTTSQAFIISNANSTTTASGTSYRITTTDDDAATTIGKAHNDARVAVTSSLEATDANETKAVSYITIREDGTDNTFTTNEDVVVIGKHIKETPMYVLNGKVVEKHLVDDLKPNDIESINVLKGEAAMEKYDSDAKDGVIEIYTKQ